MILVPGRYVAGVAIPKFLPHAMVKMRLEALGFREVTFHPRSEALPVNPHGGAIRYSEPWTEWLEAVYRGPANDHELIKLVAWLVIIPGVG